MSGMDNPQAQRCMATLGAVCPFEGCGSTRVFEDRRPMLDVEHGRLNRLMVCGLCGRKWYEVYTLTSIEDGEGCDIVDVGGRKLIKKGGRHEG